MDGLVGKDFSIFDCFVSQSKNILTLCLIEGLGSHHQRHQKKKQYN